MQFWHSFRKNFSQTPKDFARCTKFLVFFFKTTPSKCCSGQEQCYFDKFFEVFLPVDWNIFGQPPKKKKEHSLAQNVPLDIQNAVLTTSPIKRKKSGPFSLNVQKRLIVSFQKFMFFKKFLWTHSVQIRQPQRKKKNTQKT